MQLAFSKITAITVPPAHLCAGENLALQEAPEVVLQGRVFEKLLLYIGPVKSQAQYIVLNYQMPDGRGKLFFFLVLLAFRPAQCRFLPWFSQKNFCRKKPLAFSQRGILIGWRLRWKTYQRMKSCDWL